MKTGSKWIIGVELELESQSYYQYKTRDLCSLEKNEMFNRPGINASCVNSESNHVNTYPSKAPIMPPATKPGRPKFILKRLPVTAI